MRILPITLLLTISFLALSCSNEQKEPQPTEPELVEMTFVATIEGDENDNDTKTAFSREDHSVRHIYWQEGDEISVFDGTYNQKFTLTGGAGTKQGKFSGLAAISAAGTYYALYPYQENASLSNGIIQNAIIPSSQTAAVNPRDNIVSSFDPKAGLMVAKTTVSDNTTPSFSFKNVCGFLKLILDRNDINTIAFTSCETQNNSFLSIAGTVNITFENGNPKTTATSGTNAISLNSSSGALETDTFYIAMLPNSFKGTFNISYISSNKVYSKFYSATSSNPLTIQRSHIKGIGTPKPQEINEWVDLGEKNASGDAVLWRAWNLGASSPQTAGYFYAWAEAKHRDYTIATTPTSGTSYYYQITSDKPFNLSNTPYYDSSKTTEDIHFSKYNTEPSGYVGDALSTDDDAATQELSTQQGVRMPTINELVWLQDTKNCEYFRVGNFMGSGISGCVFKSKITGYTGNWIFMPMLGNCQEDKNYYDQKGTTSPYWSSNYAKNPNYAFVLFLNRNETTDEVEVKAATGGTTSGSGTTYNRYIGCQIRPVKEGTN